MADTVRRSPSRTKSILIESPGMRSRIAATKPAWPLTGSPSTAKTMSPMNTPACSAGEPGCTVAIIEPAPPSLRASRLTPKNPSARGMPEACSRNCSNTVSTSSTEMAKPMLLAAELLLPRATAVLMPTTSPRMLTNGPPELPDEIAASV